MSFSGWFLCNFNFSGFYNYHNINRKWHFLLNIIHWRLITKKYLIFKSGFKCANNFNHWIHHVTNTWCCIPLTYVRLSKEYLMWKVILYIKLTPNSIDLFHQLIVFYQKECIISSYMGFKNVIGNLLRQYLSFSIFIVIILKVTLWLSKSLQCFNLLISIYYVIAYEIVQDLYYKIF